ncbi:TadE/TadG family type IV pilus assembly protein [Corallococcus terminator]
MRSIDRPRIASGQSGQAAVETAIIVPMLVFMVLGIIQLGMVHNARLMTEYGAYRAVRAGIVNHGDCGLMERAALTALLPTLPPLGGKPGRVDTVREAVAVHKAFSRKLFGEGLLARFYARAPALPLFRVQVLNPKKSELAELFGTYGSHLDQLEIDYDDVRDERVIEANLLSVRLTYFYELRIPFANWQLHSFYLGREYLDQLKGIQFERQRVGGRNATQYLQDRGRTLSTDHAKVVTLAQQERKYVMPLVATWSMRMQSNLLNNDQHGPGRCVVND